MANDLFEKFTVGGLTSGVGKGVNIMCMSGEIVELDQARSVWKITPDGVTTTVQGSADPGSCKLTHGCGYVEIRNYDADGTGTGNEGGVAELVLHFGDISSTPPSVTQDKGHLKVIGGWAVAGFDIGGGTVASAVVDMIAPISLKRIAHNAIHFDIGAPYEQEGGSQVSISTNTILKFSAFVIVQGGGIRGQAT